LTRGGGACWEKGLTVDTFISVRAVADVDFPTDHFSTTATIFTWVGVAEGGFILTVATLESLSTGACVCGSLLGTEVEELVVACGAVLAGQGVAWEGLWGCGWHNWCGVLCL